MAPTHTHGSIYFLVTHPSEPHFTLLTTTLSPPSVLSPTLNIRHGTTRTTFANQLLEIEITEHLTPNQDVITLYFRIRGLKLGRSLLTSFARPIEDAHPFTKQFCRIEKNGDTGRRLRGQTLERNVAERQYWDVRVLAHVAKDGEVWSLVRMGEPFCRFGRLEMRLEVDAERGLLLEERRDVRRGGGEGLEEGVLVPAEGCDVMMV